MNTAIAKIGFIREVEVIVGTAAPSCAKSVDLVRNKPYLSLTDLRALPQSKLISEGKKVLQYITYTFQEQVGSNTELLTGARV